MKKSTKTDAAKSPGCKKPRRLESPAKPYWEMTTDELRQATAEFDRDFVGGSFGPPTTRQQ